MKAHTLTFNNRVFVIVETMHKEVYIITDDSEMKINYSYEQTVTRLENEGFNDRNLYVVYTN